MHARLQTCENAGLPASLPSVTPCMGLLIASLVDKYQGMPALGPLDDITNSDIGQRCVAAVLVNGVSLLGQDLMHAVGVGSSVHDKQAALSQKHLRWQHTMRSASSAG